MFTGSAWCPSRTSKRNRGGFGRTLVIPNDAAPEQHQHDQQCDLDAPEVCAALTPSEAAVNHLLRPRCDRGQLLYVCRKPL